MTTCIPTGFTPQYGTANGTLGTPFPGWGDPTNGTWPTGYANAPQGGANFWPGFTPTNFVPSAYPTNFFPGNWNVTPWGINPFFNTTINPFINTFNPYFNSFNGARPGTFGTPLSTPPGTPWNGFTPSPNTFNPYVNTFNPFFNTFNPITGPWNFGGFNNWSAPWSNTYNSFPGFNTPWNSVGTPWGINPGFQGPAAWNNFPGAGYIPGYTNGAGPGYPSPIGAPIPGMNVEHNEKSQKRGILNRDAA